MTVEKENKRITLFPNDAHPLSEEALIDYVSPMGEIDFLPKVNKGVTIRIDPSGNVDKIDAWTIEFNHSENLFKVTVDVDRVVIESESAIEWRSMLEKVYPIIEIVVKNNPEGLSRIAVGATAIGSASLEELRDFINISNEEIQDKSAREKIVRFVRVCCLPDDNGEELLKYNDVHTYKVIWQKDEFNYINDYDINTSADTDAEVVTSSLNRFLSDVIERLSETCDSHKGMEGL